MVRWTHAGWCSWSAATPPPTVAGVQAVRSPSLTRLLVTLAGLLVLGGALVIGVLATVGTAARARARPSRTADGSTCSPLGGECSQLSRSAVEQMVGITLPAGTRLVSSGSRDVFKASESWAVACVPEAQRVFDAAEPTASSRAHPPTTPNAATGPTSSPRTSRCIERRNSSRPVAPARRSLLGRLVRLPRHFLDK